MKDALYVYRPGFLDGGVPYFCPFSAQVIGFLTYYPAVRHTVDLVELDFARPREPLASLLGPDHQSAPILVLASAPTSPPANVHISHANDRAFVEKTIEILRYLAATRGVPQPH